MAEREPASYRDPLGHIIYSEGRVIRRLSPKGAELWKGFSKSALFESLRVKKMVVGTKELINHAFSDSEYPMALEHEKVPFISYAYEWSFEMLKDSALLTLDIMLESLKHGFILRDGTPFNIQFIRGRPVFIDILSFEPYENGMIWIGYAQFCRMFLFPLMLASHKKVNFHPWIRGSLEGISLEDMAGIFGWSDILKKGVLFQIFLQNRLNKSKVEKKGQSKPSTSGMTAEKLDLIIHQLRGTVSSLQSPFKNTTWSEYANSHSYDEKEQSTKVEFVEKVCGQKKRNLVWDIGANIGKYSLIAAKHAELVIAMDSDHGALDTLSSNVRERKEEKILPLLIDIADPSPSSGWLNKETKTVSERGRPDLVLALALIHHLCISRNIEMASFVEWITGIADEGVVEFVSKEDPMVQQLLATREDIFGGYTKSRFESMLSEKAEIIDSCEISQSKRHIYHFRSK